MFKAVDQNNEYRVRNLSLEQHWSAILKGDLPSPSSCVSLSLFHIYHPLSLSPPSWTNPSQELGAVNLGYKRDSYREFSSEQRV
jgi:hypothetical protein